MLLDANAITPEQASQVPQNVIMQALGTQPVVKVVMSGVELCQNDYLLLCSDGLSNKVTQDEMRQVVYESENINAACRRLIEMANERGGEDNITVVIARFDGDSLHSASDSLSITGSFVAIEETGRRITQRDLSDIDTSEAASVTTLVVPSFDGKPEAEETVADEEIPTDRLDASQVAGFDEVPTTRLDLPAVEGEPSAPEAAETPVTKTFSSKKEKKSFSPIIIFALVAAALLAATFFFYKFVYQKQAAPPPSPPANDQTQQSQPSSADQPPTNQTEAAPAEPTPEEGRPKKQISPDSSSEKKDSDKAQDNSNRD
jgi:protein phosphatase